MQNTGVSKLLIFSNFKWFCKNDEQTKHIVWMN
jgi:hypothetical protein